MLLQNLAWNFTKKSYSSIQEFEDKFRLYQRTVLKDKTDWDPYLVVTEASEIEIIYECWQNGGQVEMITKIHSANASSITVLELMYLLHQELATKELGDRKFFEGLQMIQDKGVYRYRLRLGS